MLYKTNIRDKPKSNCELIAIAAIVTLTALLSTSASALSRSVHIIAPNLELPSNKISPATAEMPDLIFSIQPRGFKFPASAKFKWWVRVQYQTAKLSMQSRVKTIGCDQPIALRRVAVWALPAGKINEICVRDMSKRNIWISTPGPLLNLYNPIQIEKSDGSRHIVKTKNKDGEPLSHDGMLLYGGGRLEIVAKVEYRTPQGQYQSHIARFPNNYRSSSFSHQLKGLNPNLQQRQAQFQGVSDALYTPNPTNEQSQLRQQITGNENSTPIPEELHTVLPELISAIACRETRWRHFCEKGFCIGVERVRGFPIVAFDGGYGMFQLTIPHPNYYQKWSWKENLVNTMQRMNRFISNTEKLANTMPNAAERNRVYYRELISRHNASAIGYYENGKRRPILCREKVAFDNNTPNTNPLYRKNLEHNRALLQALEVFGRRLQTNRGIQCDVKKGRNIKISHRGNILAVSACRPGKHQLLRGKKITNTIVLPAHVREPLRRFGRGLIDNKHASCNGSGLNKNAGRRIVGTFRPPNNYHIELVGPCHNSPTCYVDVDSESRNNIRDGCISPKARRRF